MFVLKSLPVTMLQAQPASETQAVQMQMRRVVNGPRLSPPTEGGGSLKGQPVLLPCECAPRAGCRGHRT